MQKNERRLVGLIFVVAFNLRVGISSVPALLELIKKDLGISNFQSSLITSIPVICMGVFALTVPYFQRTLGRRRTIFFSLLILGLGTLARFFVTSYNLFLITAFMIGFGIAIIGPLLSGFIKSNFPFRSGLMIGVYSLSMGLGASLSSGLVLPLTEYFKGNWGTSLALWGVFAIIAALIWQMFSPIESQHKSAKSTSFSLPLKNRKAWKYTLFFGIQSGIFYGMTTWLALTALEKGSITLQSGYFLTLYTVIQMFCSFIIPTLMDQFGKMKQWMFFSSGLVFIGAGMIALAPSVVFFVVGIILAAIGLGGLFPIAVLLPIRNTKTAEETSLWTSMIQSFGYILGGFMPVIMGAVKDTTGSTIAPFLIMVLLSSVLLILSFSEKNEPSIDL
ncbi:MFS transporter [Carnobacterium maltaromaticum]|uniref:MFS transporter n=1 Tax=Carnobacterium maltaromaticum TaxID=2751 RepID=UPI000C78EFD8|nr:MFS transporter [Carnobacterium maltaromaticum]PLS32210.1 MFS transporter [Carnobacterium maltaromaticum]PLS32326.1 MFS transporter [Carnobacterium maltaromaticum]PLS32399.1 MFS transporter [Carnobacterium maltaromaticum]PLS40656.1 MFS transporter [Carnobacterium maltaromaticum]PLS40951.1 MFS transporter [Carnobacterium maltaromaticum]